jgi:UPF0755 protein
LIGESPPDRSQEEREAARLARERARAEREAAARPRAPVKADAASRPRAASVRERADALLSARGSRSRDGRPPREERSGTPSRRRRLVLLGVLAAVAILAAWILLSLFQPFKGDGEGTVAVTIPRGAGVGEIADLLEERSVISSGFWFEARTTLAGARGDLKPGIYNLRRDMSYGAAIDALTEGPPRNLINVTFPEGIALREIAPRVRRAGVRGDYVRASRRSSLLDPRRYGATRARDLEGFLFPATYQLRRGASARSLVDKQVTAFKREFAKIDLRAARRVNLTAYDVLIIAALVEREAQLDEERPLVASVIYNRLKAGMNLGIDATVRYAANNWTKPVTRSQLDSPSPYNTYNHPGLPPGPIGNPGLASMRAAARPARTKYLYYVVKPCSCGVSPFAATAAEHDRNVARYEAAREARGGRSPTDC